MRAMLCACLLLVGHSVSQAADIEVIDAEPNPARFAWDGFYVGASAGYGWLNDVDRAFTPAFHDRGKDWIFGAHAGYLHSFGNFVVGAELEATRLDIDYEVFNFITVDNAYVAKAKVGYAIDRLLVTGHLGGVYATTNFMGLKDWGWAAGLGVDYALTQNLSAGMQYSHFGFSKFDGTLIDASVDALTARVSFRF